MLYEIAQIKKYLAEKYNLPLEGVGMNMKVVGNVPDGEHVIPLGRSLTPTRVVIKDDRIHIDPLAT